MIVAARWRPIKVLPLHFAHVSSSFCACLYETNPHLTTPPLVSQAPQLYDDGSSTGTSVSAKDGEIRSEFIFIWRISANLTCCRCEYRSTINQLRWKIMGMPRWSREWRWLRWMRMMMKESLTHCPMMRMRSDENLVRSSLLLIRLTQLRVFRKSQRDPWSWGRQCRNGWRLIFMANFLLRLRFCLGSSWIFVV